MTTERETMYQPIVRCASGFGEWEAQLGAAPISGKDFDAIHPAPELDGLIHYQSGPAMRCEIADHTIYAMVMRGQD